MENKKILIIEDEPDQILMVKLRLEKNGFKIITANDGEKGLESANREMPDLVLLDMLMPKMDGFEVCKRLRAQADTKDIPIIVTTAAGTDNIEKKCVEAGANICMRKPYEAGELLEKIKILLQGI